MLPDVPSDLDDLVRRMVSKDPAERPRDAAEIASLLAAIDVEPSSDIGAPQPSLTRSEQRIYGIVLAPRAVPPAGSEGRDAAALAAMQGMMARRGARLDALADGSLLTVLASNGGQRSRPRRNARSPCVARCRVARWRSPPTVPR